MKRRSFLARALGLPALPVAAKAVLVDPEPEGGLPDYGEDGMYEISDEEVCINVPGYAQRERSQWKEFVESTGPAFMTSLDDIPR